MKNILLLFHVQFIFSKNINMRHGGEYVLLQKPQAATAISLKLLNVQKSADLNNIQATAAAQWPLGIVTYYFDSDSYDEIIFQRLRSVMSTVETASCVRFNSVSSKPNNITWLHITNPQRERQCVHQMKSTNVGEIVAVLGYDCLKDKDILHTILHAIGLKDEVTHPHRDRFIRVLWNNIQPEYHRLYQIQSQGLTKTLTEYDPLSIMHFHDRAFSRNGQATIVPLVSGLTVTPSEHLSQLDSLKLRLLFEHECNKRKVTNLIDSCKNAFHSKLKGPMTDLDHNDNSDSHSCSDELASSIQSSNEIWRDTSTDNQDQDSSENDADDKLKDGDDKQQFNRNSDEKEESSTSKGETDTENEKLINKVDENESNNQDNSISDNDDGSKKISVFSDKGLQGRTKFEESIHLKPIDAT